MNNVDKLLSPEYIWLFIGILLIIIEYIKRTFFLIYLSIAALITSIISILFHPALIIQLSIFIPISIFSILYFRPKSLAWRQRLIKEYTQRKKKVIPPKGISAVALTDITMNKKGRIKLNNEIRDAVSQDEIKEGDIVKLIRNEGEVLEVKFLDRF